jgi:hypothetical protein
LSFRQCRQVTIVVVLSFYGIFVYCCCAPFNVVGCAIANHCSLFGREASPDFNVTAGRSKTTTTSQRQRIDGQSVVPGCISFRFLPSRQSPFRSVTYSIRVPASNDRLAPRMSYICIVSVRKPLFYIIHRQCRRSTGSDYQTDNRLLTDRPTDRPARRPVAPPDSTPQRSRRVRVVRRRRASAGRRTVGATGCGRTCVPGYDDRSG